MSVAELGLLGKTEWIEYTDASGVAWRFPLPEGALVIRRPLIPFAQTVQLGEPGSLVSPVIPSLTFKSFPGGFGLLKYDALKGYQSYHRGQLDTRNPNGITLPPKAISRGQPAAPPTLTAGGWRLDFWRDPATGNERVLMWCPWVAGAYQYCFTTATWEVPLFSAQTVTGFVRHNGVSLVTTTAGIYWATAAAWTLVAASLTTFKGLCTHDNKVWAFDNATKTIFLTTDAVASAMAVKPGSLALKSNGAVCQLIEWRDKANAPAIYALTDGPELYGFDEEPGEWVLAWSEENAVKGTIRPKAVTWGRDNNLYIAPYDASEVDNHAFVFQLTGAEDQLGPSRQLGLDPLEMVANVHSLASSTHWLFGAGRTASTAGIMQNGGMTGAMDDNQGWHPLLSNTYQGFNQATVGMGYWRGRLCTFLANGQLLEQDVPDRLAFPPRTLGKDYDGNTAHTLTTGLFDLGQADRWKIGHYLFLDVRRADNRPGMETGTTVTIGLIYDNTFSGAFSYTAPGLTTVSPLIFPLNNGQGQAFRQGQLQISALAPAATVAPSPIIQSFGIYYTPWDDPKFSYQVPIDLTTATFKKRYSEGKFFGKTEGELAAQLLTMMALKTRHQLVFGSADKRITVAAVDLQLSSREGMGGGIYNLSFRDITPPS